MFLGNEIMRRANVVVFVSFLGNEITWRANVVAFVSESILAWTVFQTRSFTFQYCIQYIVRVVFTENFNCIPGLSCKNCLNEDRSYFVNKFWGMKKILRPAIYRENYNDGEQQFFRSWILLIVNGSLCSKERHVVTFGHISQFVCYMLAFLFIEHHSNTSISLV